MRAIALALLALVLLVPNLGCMAFSSHTRDTCRRSVVVYEGEMYVVDLNNRVAHKVAIARQDASGHSETVVIEQEG